MPEDIRIWEILKGDDLKEIRKAKLDFEARIEDWLEKDISIISDDLLVIGRQVETDFGGIVDLLCLDHNGDVVIVELKRDRTPREITAQTLDYASWVKDLSNERITAIADKYLRDKSHSLEQAFERRFGVELPEVLNGHHEMLIVAPEVDSSSERIIKYLSDTYGVAINAATFQYFRDENSREFLARGFLIEPSQVEYSTQTKTSSKRKPPLTYEELQEIAESNGVGNIYESLVEGLTDYFDQRSTTRTTVAFIGILEESRNTIFSVVPGESDASQGVWFQVFVDRLSKYLSTSTDKVIEILPSGSEEYAPYKGAPRTFGGFFKEVSAVGRFLKDLSRLSK